MGEVNLSDIREQAAAKVKDLSVWEGALGVVDVVMKLKASTAELTAKDNRIKAAVAAGEKDLASVSEKSSGARKKLSVLEAEVKAKDTQASELNDYLLRGFKEKEAIFERESKKKISAMQLQVDAVIKELNNKVVAAKEELAITNKAIDKAHLEMKEIRQSFLALAG